MGETLEVHFLTRDPCLGLNLYSFLPQQSPGLLTPVSTLVGRQIEQAPIGGSRRHVRRWASAVGRAVHWTLPFVTAYRSLIDSRTASPRSPLP